METKTDTKNTLTPQQEAVVDLLATGATLTDAAQAAGVARQTVSEWHNQNHTFRAALNERRNEIWGDRCERLRSLATRALDVIERELTGKRALDAAIHVLKATGLYDIGAPPRGETDPKTIESLDRTIEIMQRVFSDPSS
jgi:hypothetical protein